MEKYATPQYTRDAVAAYRKRNKILQVAIPSEDWERMQAQGMTARDVKPLILAELERREAEAGAE